MNYYLYTPLLPLSLNTRCIFDIGLWQGNAGRVEPGGGHGNRNNLQQQFRCAR